MTDAAREARAETMGASKVLANLGLRRNPGEEPFDNQRSGLTVKSILIGDDVAPDDREDRQHAVAFGRSE